MYFRTDLYRACTKIRHERGRRRLGDRLLFFWMNSASPSPVWHLIIHVEESSIVDATCAFIYYLLLLFYTFLHSYWMCCDVFDGTVSVLVSHILLSILFFPFLLFLFRRPARIASFHHPYTVRFYTKLTGGGKKEKYTNRNEREREREGGRERLAITYPTESRTRLNTACGKGGSKRGWKYRFRLDDHRPNKIALLVNSNCVYKRERERRWRNDAGEESTRLECRINCV